MAVHAGAGGGQALQIVARPTKLWLGPLNLAVLLIHCGQPILRKISKFDAARCQILRLKCTKFDFRCGYVSDSAGGACNAPPDSLAAFKGAYF